MGEFDFTYRLPQNFSRRVVQYLEQLESPNVARAFQNCTYDYEDLGLAYYAGMKGDNWDKKALDFTVEGSPRDIALLKSKGISIITNLRGCLQFAKIERAYTERIYQQIT